MLLRIRRRECAPRPHLPRRGCCPSLPQPCRCRRRRPHRAQEERHTKRRGDGVPRSFASHRRERRIMDRAPPHHQPVAPTLASAQCSLPRRRGKLWVVAVGLRQDASRREVIHFCVVSLLRAKMPSSNAPWRQLETDASRYSAPGHAFLRLPTHLRGLLEIA